MGHDEKTFRKCVPSVDRKSSDAHDWSRGERKIYAEILAQLKSDLFPKFFGLICVGTYWPIYNGCMALEGLVVAECAQLYIHE